MQGLITPLAGVKQQGCGIGREHLWGLAVDRDQGIGDQQGAAGLMEAGELVKPTKPQIDRSECLPTELFGMGVTLLPQHMRSRSGETQPCRWQLQRKAPLSRRDPELRLRKGPRHRRHRQLVFQAGSGGQHDGADGTVERFKVAQVAQQLSSGCHGGVQHQPGPHTDHRHADRHGHVEDPLQLLKAPDLARNQLAYQGAAPAIGVEGQQRPPGPVLLLRTLLPGCLLITHLLHQGSSPPAMAAAHPGNSPRTATCFDPSGPRTEKPPWETGARGCLADLGLQHLEPTGRAEART
jgi:hypothetical protein